MMSDAVRRFQKRNGLSVDGRLGPATSKALAVTAEDRAATIELSLERLRWLPRDLGRRHLRVNIPHYRLQLIEDEQSKLDMRVIVGRRDRPTATFSDAVAYLVFYPYWEVPRTLAVEDELPKAQADPSWIQKRNFEVLQGWDENARALDPAAIDWSALDHDRFPYRLRQRPGSGNALGRDQVHVSQRLRHLPARHAKSKAVRTGRPQSELRVASGWRILSSLQAELLEGTPLWDRWRIANVLEAGKQTTARLLDPVPIHLVYFTAWPDEEGRIGFFDDIYQLDPGLSADLKR